MFRLHVSRLQVVLSAFSAVVVGAGLLVGANVVAADSVQVQSYQRDSQTAECPNQPWETPWQADWGPDSSWQPSWEQWANNGTGGWTCTRSIVWARNSPVTYNLGDIGPGGGLVFLKAAGLTYEMAPKNWGVNETTAIAWCNVTDSDVAGATGIAIGTGSANTTAMVAACASGAGNSARAYNGGGFSDWFLPSKDELNAMDLYGAVPTAYGFAGERYWSSSQLEDIFPFFAWFQDFRDLPSGNTNKFTTLRVRPIRAF